MVLYPAIRKCHLKYLIPMPIIKNIIDNMYKIDTISLHLLIIKLNP